MNNPSRIAVELCKAVGWGDAKNVPLDAYVELLETAFETAETFLDGADMHVQKHLQKLDDAGVKQLRKKLAFPEGTVAVLPQEDDLVVCFRGLTRFERDHIEKAYGKKVIGTSKSGLARVNKSGQIDPTTVQPAEQLDAIDKLIELTALAMQQRQANPEDVRGKTQIAWRLNDDE